MEKLVRLLYVSEAIRPFARPELEELAAKSVARNRTLGVTGILLYSSGTFAQCIEGPVSEIRSLYARIESDRRHTRVMQVCYEPIGRRLFGHWWMGLLNLDDAAMPIQRSQLVTMVRAAREGSKINVVTLLKSFRAALPTEPAATA